jgi:DNA-binding HxlR family transcriptional regulator
MQVNLVRWGVVAGKKPARRSSCPINAALETFGDRWSLLIIRDLMFRGRRTYKEFLASEERIATNILASRLKTLKRSGIVTTRPDAEDGRRLIYALTKKGVDLAPILVGLAVWASRYERTSAPPSLMRRMKDDPDGFLAEIAQRWADAQGADDLLTGSE